MSEETAVSGSAPDAKPGNHEAQTEGDTVQPARRMSLSDAIKAELGGLGKEELEESDGSGDGDSEPVDESEDAEQSDEDKAEGREDDDEDDESEDSSDDDEDEDSEDDDDEDSEVSVKTQKAFKKRLDREIEKRKKSQAELEKVQQMTEELQSQLEESKQLTQYRDYIDYILEMSEYMPELREAIENIPVFNGKEPTIDDFESPEKYAEWREKQAEKRFKQDSSSKSDEAKTEAQISETLDRLESEIETLRKDDFMSKYMDEDHLKEVRSFLIDQGIDNLASGSTRFDSIEKIARYLFIDEMTEDLRKQGAEKAVKKIDKSRKKVSLRSKGSSKTPSKKVNPRSMTTMQAIRAEIEASQQGL